MASANLSVLVGKNFACIKIVGRANFASSPDFKTLLSELAQKGFAHFIIDLGECVLMDSTFLGVLAGIGLQLREPTTSGQVRIININPRNLELLQTLGLDRLFDLPATRAPEPAGPMQLLPDSETIQLPDPAGKKDTAELMLEAHTNLIRADNRNLSKFKDVTAVLRARTEPNPDKPK